MSDITTLRKMTWKSMLNEGKYKDHSIQQVFNLHHTRYLRYIYYNYSAMTFIDEILDAIRIPEDMRIEKPGKNPEIGEELNKKLDCRTTVKIRKRIQAGYNEFKRMENYIVNSKSRNRAINQGKFKK